MIYDISRTLSADTATWPGDQPIALGQTASQANGAPVSTGAVQMTVHAGSHVDAPAHVLPGGATVDTLALDRCLGEAVVVDCGEARLIDEAAAARAVSAGAERVLFKTRGSRRPSDVWWDDFPALTAAAATQLVTGGVKLVGVDTPSVDPYGAQRLEAHQILLGAGVVVLENLQLGGVPPGAYELIALPLKLQGLDGSPVRAVLRTLAEQG